MAVRMKFTEEQKREIIERYGDGASINEIMRLMGVSSTPVRRLLRDAGVLRPVQGSVLKQSRNQRVLEFDAAGEYTLDEIGKAVGLTRQRVHQIIARGY